MYIYICKRMNLPYHLHRCIWLCLLVTLTCIALSSFYTIPPYIHACCNVMYNPYLMWYRMKLEALSLAALSILPSLHAQGVVSLTALPVMQKSGKPFASSSCDFTDSKGNYYDLSYLKNYYGYVLWLDQDTCMCVYIMCVICTMLSYVCMLYFHSQWIYNINALAF